MNWWNILEISYDSDLKTIKKAYAKLLKIYNPEDDAEGYQRLREAYNAAVKYAKKNNDNQKAQKFIDDNLDKSNINEVHINNNEDKLSESRTDSYIDYINYEAGKTKIEDEQIKFKSNININEIYIEKQDTNINLNEQIKQFSNRLNEIYNNIYLRTDSAAWEELLNSDVIWNVQAFSIIEDDMFNFLIKHRYLPVEIWTKLNNNFNWSKNEIKLYDKYSESIVNEFLKNLKNPSKLKYDYIRSISPEIADEYLYERQQADEALENEKYAKAYKHLKKANSLFNQDAELLRLMGNYNYELNDIEKALEFYKSAFEINNYDLKSALRIGIILVSFERFSEAISYLNVYLSYNNNDKLALNHIAYCYYYNDDLIMARENFQKLIYLYDNNKTIKKYLKNIESQLEGKNVRKIRFDKDNLMAEEVVKKEIKTKEIYIEKQQNKPLNTRGIIRGIICLIMIISALGRISANKDQAESNYNKANKSYEDKKKVVDNNNIFTKVYSVTGFLDTEFNTNIRISLSNVKPIEYYKISEPFENRVIFSESELDQKGLRGKVESQLYIGLLNNYNIFMFADSKFSNKAIDKNGIYEVKGSKYGTQDDAFDMIEKKYMSYYSGYIWVGNGFVDASQTEIDKAQKNSESIKQVGDRKIKIIKSAQEYKDSRFSGAISVPLTNVIPLDLYYCKYDDKNPSFYSKKEMNQNNLWNKTWIQAYSGTINNLNIMFIDSNFSRDLIKSDGGCTVEGRKYMYRPDETTNIATEEGQGVSKVGIYGWFIDNSGQK
ncbi:hypothetical protein psyc5s11_17780 [Clostridium gelidum]|uniref:J domain-containing protein n=1 Tax=Clostridium gelidum TaxID=704125 RepID=A0ABM7T348_9CLOT|nr:J domain-containing protein [Clostridium gelidum]BCZ45711.1 hypothetical protein psyc5s11_17780 [Clostridium gelidum]